MRKGSVCISVKDTNAGGQGDSRGEKEAGAHGGHLPKPTPPGHLSKALHRPYSSCTGAGSTYPSSNQRRAAAGPLNRRRRPRATTPVGRPRRSAREHPGAHACMGLRGYAGRIGWRYPLAYAKQFDE